MNIRITFIFIFLFSLNCYSQQSSEYIALIKDLKPRKTKTIDLKFSNGNQKEIGFSNEFEFGDYIYSYYTGKRTQYYRKGTIVYEYEYDDFGVLLSCRWYDGFDNLLRETLTLEIDSKAKNLKEFLDSDKHLTIKTIERIYRWSTDLNKYYVKKEGKKINGKKVGIWKTYSDNGNLIKESNHKVLE